MDRIRVRDIVVNIGLTSGPYNDPSWNKISEISMQVGEGGRRTLMLTLCQGHEPE